MLQRQEPEENTPLIEHRVTTEEFTQAVAALESRKEEERQRLAGTVPIAQTVQELGIDAAPDEIWTEVQAQRARQAAAQTAPPPHEETGQQIPNRNYFPYQSVYRDVPRRHQRWFTILIMAFFFTRIFSLNVHHPHGVVSPITTTTASIKTLAEIPNGHTVYCDNATLQNLDFEIDHVGPPSQALVHEQRGKNDWALIKYDGHVYLRGYTIALSDQAMQAQPVKIYNSSPAQGLPITVRLDRLEWQGNMSGGDMNGNWSEITVSHPQLDSHAHEAWSP
jgi:hypothetical protein